MHAHIHTYINTNLCKQMNKHENSNKRYFQISLTQKLEIMMFRPMRFLIKDARTITYNISQVEAN